MNPQNLQELIGAPNKERDSSWKKLFYECIQTTPLSPRESFEGPDGFPYLKVMLAGNSEDGVLKIKDLLDKCLEDGMGIACFDADDALVWVFSYGALRSLRERGNFETYESHSLPNTDVVTKVPISASSEAFERRAVQEKREALFGQPSELFFPTYARNVVKKHLLENGIAEPKMLLFVDSTLTPPQSILFSIFPDDFPDEQKFRVFMNRLAWFFPPPYGVISMTKEVTKNYHFKPL